MMWLIIFGAIFAISIIALVVSRALWRYDFSDWLTPLSVCTMIISLVVCVGLLAARVEAKQQCLAFEEVKSMCISNVANAENWENVGITGTIIEQNTWLVNTKASVREFGVWSIYYNLGVEEMEYISLGGS